MTMRGALAALALAAASPAALAKDEGTADYSGQVRTYLADQAVKHTSEGYRADAGIADFVRAIRLDGGVIWQPTLQAGANYRLLAVCDNDCSDVDMEAFDAAGNFIERDVSTSDNPYVEITPAANGPIYVRIWLAACESEPCYVAVRAYRK
jgi:hypothetical protein